VQGLHHGLPDQDGIAPVLLGNGCSAELIVIAIPDSGCVVGREPAKPFVAVIVGRTSFAGCQGVGRAAPGCRAARLENTLHQVSHDESGLGLVDLGEYRTVLQ